MLVKGVVLEPPSKDNENMWVVTGVNLHIVLFSSLSRRTLDDENGIRIARIADLYTNVR